MNQPAWVPEFQAFNREVMAESETPGLAVAVALDGETVYEDGYGLRDRERGLPVTSETIFGIGSLTKSFTTLSIMQLADAGNLSVNDPVVKFLPEFRVPRPKSEAPITLHHLMSHCSGLPEEPLLVHARGPSMRRDPDIKKIRGQQLPSAFFTPEYAAKDITNYNGLLALLAEASFEMLGPPENHHSYSDESFALLQGVVERVSGKPMVSYLRENIWQPLGMEHTGTQAEMVAKHENTTSLFARGDAGVFQSPAWHDIGEIVGNGGLASNTGDLLRYIEVYRNLGTVKGVRVVSPEAVEMMTSPQMATPLDAAFGYGLQVLKDYHGVDLIGHGGGNKGIAADMALVRERGFTAVALTNLAAAPAPRITTGALNAVLGLPFGTPRVEFSEYEMEASELAEYTGVFWTERQAPQFSVAEGSLRMTRDEATVTLRPVGRDRFLIPGTGPLRFLRDTNGEVWAVYLGSRTIPKKK